jgi:preprotein translocase subunit YajC
MPNDLTQMGAVAIIFIFAIKEFFAFLKARKNNSNNGNIMKALKLIEDNHLGGLNNKIDKLDDKLDKVINILTEIKVRFDRYK